MLSPILTTINGFLGSSGLMVSRLPSLASGESLIPVIRTPSREPKACQHDTHQFLQGCQQAKPSLLQMRIRKNGDNPYTALTRTIIPRLLSSYGTGYGTEKTLSAPHLYVPVYGTDGSPRPPTPTCDVRVSLHQSSFVSAPACSFSPANVCNASSKFCQVCFSAIFISLQVYPIYAPVFICVSSTILLVFYMPQQALVHLIK